MVNLLDFGYRVSSSINKGYKKSSARGNIIIRHISLMLLLLFSSGDSFGSYTDCKNRVHSSLTRASYTAQFTDWSAAALPALDTKFNQLYRRLSGNMPTFPTRLLYLPTSSGGLGLPRLSTYVNMRKWSMAQRALTHERPTHTAQAVAGLLDRAARYSGCPTDSGGAVSIGYTSRAPSWGLV